MVWALQASVRGAWAWGVVGGQWRPWVDQGASNLGVLSPRCESAQECVLDVVAGHPAHDVQVRRDLGVQK